MLLWAPLTISFYTTQVSHNSYHLWCITLSHLLAFFKYFSFSNFPTISHSLSLQCKQSTVNSYRYSFFVNGIFSWNSVPYEILSVCHRPSFKHVSYSTIYRDHEGLGVLAQNYHSKTSLIFTFWHFGSIG